MAHEFVIPDKFWRSLCEDVNHPLACVDLDNRFVWVNEAFQKLVGYSYGELCSKTWMDITYQPDIGGDMASVRSVIEGRSDAYTMHKKYIHRTGRQVSIQLTVRRFPESILENMVCFRVESPEVIATVNDINAVRDTLMLHLQDIRNRVLIHDEKLAHEKWDREKERDYKNDKSVVEINMDRSVGGDVIGRDKNSDNAIKFLAGALIALVVIAGWFMYYIASVANKAPMQAPPAIPSEVNK